MRELSSYIQQNWQEILDKTIEHTWLTLAALFLAAYAGIALGILITRSQRLSGPILGFANILQTIPSLALLGFLLPFLGIGAKPAIVALFLYALLPIIRNTFAGIKEADPAVIEASKGMGLSEWQRLMKIEIPLAIPVIFAGLRTATVINVGVATLCALIAAGGLGEFIFQGIALNNSSMILAGAIPSALLALSFDLILGYIQKRVAQNMRFVLIGAVILNILMLAWAFWPSESQTTLKAGFDPEFSERPDGWIGLREVYDMDISSVKMNPGLMYKALKNKEVDVISGYSTDGRIDAFKLVVLEDDQRFFPPYYPAPVINGKTLARFPEIETALAKVQGKISGPEMRKMNNRADKDKIPPKQVALAFLSEMGLSTNIERTEGEPDILIGSKQFTESYILAEMLAILIENYTTLNAETKLNLGGTKICHEALVEGEIDITAEYTGTAFLVTLKADKEMQDQLNGDPDKIFEFVKAESSEQFGLEWLPPFGFNNTYALMVREETAKKYQLESISDLSRALKE